MADFLKEVCATTHHRLDDLTHYLYSINGHVRVIPALSALAAAAAAAAALAAAATTAAATTAAAATALAAAAPAALTTAATRLPMRRYPVPPASSLRLHHAPPALA